MKQKKYVCYEDFGAVGDGKTHDFAAICAAHEYANEHGLDVVCKGNKTYYIGDTGENPPAQIKTNVDWGNSKFIIDDSGIASDMKGRTAMLFKVCPETPGVDYTPDGDSVPSAKIREINAAGGIKADVKKLDLGIGYPAMLVVINHNHRNYIRFGANKNAGLYQTEIVVVDAEGNIDKTTPFLLDYAEITKIGVYKMDDTPITLKGGMFTTIANQSKEDYRYYSRNIGIYRSNTTVTGLTHKIVGEGEHGDPYSAFVNISYACNILIKDSFFQAHKCYVCVGSGGAPVGMGTYDIGAFYGNNILWKNCVETNFYDENGERTNETWGIMGSSFTKNIAYEDCILSRFDAHEGVYNARIINSTIVYFRVIGGGTLHLENLKIHNNLLISMREDYGATWNGNIIIKDVTMLNSGDVTLLSASWENHDFGYKCYLANDIVIDNLKLEKPANVHLFYPSFLKKGDVSGDTYNGEPNINPYQPPKSITIKNNADGYNFVIPDSSFFKNTKITKE